MLRDEDKKKGIPPSESRQSGLPAHPGGHADQASSMDLREIREDYVQDSQT